MASTGKCRYCGGVVRSDERVCPNCGAANEGFVANTEKTVFLPKTIEELKEYCAQRGMPLLRMRFFIGEDFKEPRAFGIYRDGNQFVVYKNKSDGSRSIRYRGPDESFAVNELFMKLLDECHKRGIYPDGKPVESRSGKRVRTTSRSRQSLIAVIIILVLSILITAVSARVSTLRHQYDGYYQGEDTNLYYRYGETWYTNSGSSSWFEIETDPFPGDFEETYEEYYLGDSFDSDWEGSDFRESAVWKEIHESSSSSSSDYDSWDSNDTDWDSDW